MTFELPQLSGGLSQIDGSIRIQNQSCCADENAQMTGFVQQIVPVFLVKDDLGLK